MQQDTTIYAIQPPAKLQEPILQPNYTVAEMPITGPKNPKKASIISFFMGMLEKSMQHRKEVMAKDNAQMKEVIEGKSV